MMRSHLIPPGSWRLVLSLLMLISISAQVALGQESSSPAKNVESATPGNVQGSTQPTVEQLAERLRALEVMNQNLNTQMERMTREHNSQLSQLLDRFETRFGAKANPGNSDLTSDDSEASTESPVPDYMDGVFSPYPPASSFPGVRRSGRKPLVASFGPGFMLRTEDEQFGLQIHYESQVEGRLWGQLDQVPANSGIYLPRQRFFFNGNITKWVEYELAINRGLGNINLLNAYLNFHFNDKFEIRIGRFFTPMLYEQYAISNYWLLTPERSLFTTNLSLNRQIGAMAWGYLFDKRLDYAAGVFNGSRNSFENLNNTLDFVGYINTRPFQKSETLKFARFLNLGSSVAFGVQDEAPSPATFRVGAGSPDTNIPSTATVPFLIFNRGVLERGDRLIGSSHAAYYFRSLSLLGEVQYGYGGYVASSSSRASISVPFSGFYVAGGYFLTGEHVERRTRVKPRRPLLPTSDDQKRGIGAWELTGRVSQLRIGESVFANGLADEKLWSNSAITTEVGMNWYLNEYMKIYMFWLHADYGKPVQYRPGSFQKTSDLIWLRAQLYF